MDEIIKLRHALHQNAELSHQESKTQDILREFLAPYRPSQVLSLCDGKSLLVEFDSGLPGKRIGFRADLDALPIDEPNPLAYKSNTPGVAHKCGHDGHMALVASLADAWQRLDYKTGKLGLIFQHAEELGEGARDVVRDPLFRNWQADEIYGFHNIPGTAAGTVIVAQHGVFASASCGLKILLKGRTSHAAEPENALSPYSAIVKTIAYIDQLSSNSADGAYVLLTVVGIEVGGENFGVAPGNGKLCVTLRSSDDTLLQKSLAAVLDFIQDLGRQQGLGIDHEITEDFPALPVDPALSNLVADIAGQQQLQVRRQAPFKWSEDFGHFQQAAKICYFGLGIGEACPPLHDPDYDFNDEAIAPYCKLLAGILAVNIEPK